MSEVRRMSPTILFIYGTLKRGGKNVRYMHGQQYLQDAVTKPLYRIYDLGPHPALVIDRREGLSVHGELWEVSAEALEKLDEFEEVPTWFNRLPISIEGYDDPVDAYFYQHTIPPGTPSGTEWPRPTT